MMAKCNILKKVLKIMNIKVHKIGWMPNHVNNAFIRSKENMKQQKKELVGLQLVISASKATLNSESWPQKWKILRMKKRWIS